MGVSAAAASGVAAARARQAQLAQVRAQLGDTIAANLAAQDQLTAALAENRLQAEALAPQLAEADARVAALDAQIAEIDQRAAALQAQIDLEQHQLDRLARALYVQPDSLVMALAQAGSLKEALDELAGLQSAARHARAVQEQLDRDREQLASDRRREAADRGQQAGARDALQAKADRLRELGGEQQAALAALQEKLASTQAELASVNVQSATTATYISEALQADQAEATAAAYESVWEQVQLLNGGTAAQGAVAFGSPLPGATLTQGFGPTDLSVEPPYGGFAHFHTGLDLAATGGTPVLAAADGVVVLAGFNAGGYGNYVVLAHAGGFDTLYGHLESIAVPQGQPVRRGQPIGTEGSTGNSTGPHLHFELRRGGQPVDPRPYLG